MGSELRTPWRVFYRAACHAQSAILCIYDCDDREIVHWAGFDSAVGKPAEKLARAHAIVNAVNSRAQQEAASAWSRKLRQEQSSAPCSKQERAMSDLPLIGAAELRLAMGELTASEVRVAQAAYRLGYSKSADRIERLEEFVERVRVIRFDPRKDYDYALDKALHALEAE